ncbi:hypothetical protein MJO28_005484 [Puccinia striiformis f. sp. tritici]|uniref:Uncharacterized protein n=3 Tax=Puccinia striiformis TaxID=27350 RepID=A0A0L0VLX8_9BASI|nr:hypothetical protein Pst134EA_009615 [Puccinia striiformis f. sp. tritici]KNE99984.1 hypothetical protein PSTG_06836 [Puccinia striiformis f. sp. tritici PST-78]POW11115.1 hypothetical protein PSTT_05507 [Puccinia striiformis]KAH9458417.1 hypothetical protein Pst134EB_010717 [Puccinia striiformis f. sp. tritici]KAH9469090.1 hypothetical protein Pst134EA_009615 [Puccinia striiformis f. sp. tritici]KAI7955084.1 hypothetical protein MJO28_005484 [Puccinia striiformis f. sp. tritici]
MPDWPDDVPKFGGSPGEDAKEWLRVMQVLLDDRQLHPVLYHVAAGCWLKGKPSQISSSQASSNKTAQEFHERFKMWRTKALSINLGNNEITNFVKKPTPGRSRTKISKANKESTERR